MTTPLPVPSASNGDPSISQPRNRVPSSHVSNGGIGASNMTPRSDSPSSFDRELLPSGERSLSAIALRAFLIGITLAASSILTAYLLLAIRSPLWRAPFFVSSLALFHYLEFHLTAHYNTRSTAVSSFLLSSNGAAYNIAHGTALAECLLTAFFFPSWSLLPPFWSKAALSAGLLLMLLGQSVRSVAMKEAGTNFNHHVQQRKNNEHILVTSGPYQYLRHPSYFGFFWWALGTQLVLGNIVSFVGYAIVLWNFFSSRIRAEEKFLVQFFGDDYVQYRRRTPVGIPFIW